MLAKLYMKAYPILIMFEFTILAMRVLYAPSTITPVVMMGFSVDIFFLVYYMKVSKTSNTIQITSPSVVGTRSRSGVDLLFRSLPLSAVRCLSWSR